MTNPPNPVKLPLMVQRNSTGANPERPNQGPGKRPKELIPMARKLKKQVQARVSATLRRRKKPELNAEEEALFRAATLHLITHHGMFLVATDVREARVKGFRVWIFTVILRYDKGDEGYVGDLLYDGDEFTFLTEQSIMDERIRKIAENPERLRKWNEYRASTLHPGKA